MYFLSPREISPAILTGESVSNLVTRAYSNSTENTVGDIMIDYEAWDRAEDLSESESEDGNYDEASDISDDTSLEEEDKELLLQSFLTMDIDNDAHYIHQLS